MDEQYKKDLEVMATTMREMVPEEAWEGMRFAPIEQLQKLADQIQTVMRVYERRMNLMESKVAEIRKVAPQIDLTPLTDIIKIDKVGADECFKAVNRMFTLIAEKGQS